MCSVPGYDASGHVEDLAAEQNTQITSIAIGKGARPSLPGWRPVLPTAAPAVLTLNFLAQARRRASTRRTKRSTQP